MSSRIPGLNLWDKQTDLYLDSKQSSGDFIGYLSYATLGPGGFPALALL